MGGAGCAIRLAQDNRNISLLPDGARLRRKSTIAARQNKENGETELSRRQAGHGTNMRESFNKVPEVTLVFWIIKIAATTLGETGGDTVTMTMQLGLSGRDRAVPRGTGAAGRPADQRQEVPPVSLLGDHRRFHDLRHDDGGFRRPLAGHRLHRRLLAAAASAAGHARPLVLGRAARSRWIPSTRRRWRCSTGRPSRSRRPSARRSATGWPTTPASATRAARWCSAPRWRSSPPPITGPTISRVMLFWAAFILTRPLGATVGDFLDKPVDDGGLALSRPLASGSSRDLHPGVPSGAAAARGLASDCAEAAPD